MRIEFRPLLTLRITHAYHAGPCPDARFLLAPGTLETLRRGRVIARERSGELHLLYEVEETGEPRVDLSGELLRIGYDPGDGNFAHHTVLPAEHPWRKLYATNLTDARTLALEGAVRLSGHALAYRLVTAARPAVVRVRDLDGAVVAEETVPAGRSDAEVNLRIPAHVSGVVALEEEAGVDSRMEPVMVEPELARSGVAAVLEIRVDEEHYGSPAVLELAFTAPAEPLRYYVVARNHGDAELAQLSVEDHGWEEEPREEIVFERVEAEEVGEEELAPDLLLAAEERLVLFRSSEPLGRRALPRRGLQLVRNGDELIGNLPQPAPGSPRAEVIVRVGRSG